MAEVKKWQKLKNSESSIAISVEMDRRKFEQMWSLSIEQSTIVSRHTIDLVGEELTKAGRDKE